MLVAYAASNPAKDTCQKACSSDYSPVCGKPAQGKGTNILFGNQCVLSNYNCEKQDKREENFPETFEISLNFLIFLQLMWRQLIQNAMTKLLFACDHKKIWNKV